MQSWLALIWFLLLCSSPFGLVKLGEVGATTPPTARDGRDGGGLAGLRRRSTVGQHVFVDSLPMGRTGFDVPSILPLIVTSSSPNVEEDEDDDHPDGIPHHLSAKYDPARSYSTPRSGPTAATDLRDYDSVFEKPCIFVTTFLTCADYFSVEEGLDHAVFCSPDGICGGKGAACGANQACARGLTCDYQKHRCVALTRTRLSRTQARIENRRKSAAASCPPGSEICPNGAGGFQCVYTSSETTECGACLAMGGRDCHTIPHALATSCRNGDCLVHACFDGFEPSADGEKCHEVHGDGKISRADSDRMS
ncbi:BZ3500_MvSof-1268-A1-R1_Chr5-1g07613 [Microbotryum saponariae]|uniref:BZ3500_MvSof-1268-A1-R1_Chr5-1g07613 protein n=1 Tax=Microbotryum saponariae TaxID=289078 RepID=A0A2X0LER6_9BASI|nr:BZ3500_MvSof-1268-A1-R1_Chr5-1g07613 [Microbotryum saponariae]SDA05484.1 BZ3501_MvSof-1269-A2-R1_Chr5-2g07437 [Microbotryum saponariae]